jgi:hypothetical protein
VPSFGAFKSRLRAAFSFRRDRVEPIEITDKIGGFTASTVGGFKNGQI